MSDANGSNGSSPGKPPPDQTVGYEAVKASEVVATGPKTHPAAPDNTIGYEPLKPDANAGSPSRSGGVFTHPSALRSGTFAGSILTAAGTRIVSEALVGPYEIIDELGKGGMGIVYKARHIHLNRTVALKMIIGGAGLSPTHLARFRGEAESVAKLNHPNIVQVYDVGEHNGAPYIALELVDGGNLAAKTLGKPQNPKFAAQTVETISRAVQVAHAANVIHRDLKPANVLLTLDGQPKVTDFGLAKDIGGEAGSGQTHAGSILGTPSYMAPEQAAGRVSDIGPGTDVYALGAILYELLVGHPPFRGESPIATIRMVLDGEVVSPRAVRNDCPRDLETICLKALQKPLHRRYLSAAELADDLAAYLDGRPISARPITPVERLVKWVRRRPTTAAMIGTAAVAAVGMIALGVVSYYAVTARAKQAEEALHDAKLAKDEGTRRLVRLNVSNGTRLLDDQDYLGSVLWFAEALKLEEGGPDRERVHRLRLKAVLDHCPRPSHVWLHEAPMTDARYDQSGRRVLTAADDGMAKVWDAATGEPVGLLEHGGPIKFAALSPDGLRAYTAGADGSFRVWDLATGKAIAADKLSVQYTGLAVSPNGKYVAGSGAAGRVRVWDAVTGEIVSTMTAGAFNDRACALKFSPDSTKFVIGSVNGSAQVFKSDTCAPVGSVLRHAKGINAVAYAPDGKRTATASADHTARQWGPDGQPIEPPLRHAAAVLAVRYSPDGKRLLTGSADRTAQLWDATSGLPVGRPAPHTGEVHLLDFSPDGRWYVTGSDDNTVQVWDAATGEPLLPPFRYTATPVALQFSPDGHHVLVAAQNRLATVWDVITPAAAAEMNTQPLPPPPTDDAVRVLNNPDGVRLVSFGGGQAVRVRRAADREPLTPVLRTGASVTAVAFTPDGKRLATGDADGAVQVWDAADGKPLWELPSRHASRILCLTFSPDGTRLASGSEDNTARVWDGASGTATVPPIRLSAGAAHVEFDPAGGILYTVTSSGKACCWDPTTAEPLTPWFPPRPDWATLLVVTDWPVEDLRAMGRLLAGQKLSAGGDVLPLDPAELRAEWRAIREKYPREVGPRAEGVTGWRAKQATAAEDAGNWFAAAWQLDRLLEDRPDDAELRGWRAAVADSLGDYPRAAAEADRAIRLRPTVADHWHARGKARALNKEWDKAASDLAMAVRLKADPTVGVGLAARVALHAGDVVAYRTACRTLIENPPADPTAARTATWVCALGTESGVDPGKLVAMAGTPTDPPGTAVLALAMIRAGRAEEALVLVKPLADATDKPAVWLVASLAATRAGKTADAAAWKKKASEWLTRATAPNAVPPAWDERTEVEALLKDAK